MDSADTLDVRPDRSTDSAGLHRSPDAAIDAVATVDADRHAPADLYQQIVTSDDFQRDLVDAVRELLAGTRRPEWTSTLFEAGVTARDGRYAQLVGWLDRPPESDAHQDALEYTAALGQGQVTIFGDYATLDDLLEDDLATGPLALLDAVDLTPTIVAKIPDYETFADQRRREQRERTLTLLRELADVCDVRLVCGLDTARTLYDEHRDCFPDDFDEQLTTGHLPADQAVDEALTALDPDGTAVRLLRVLADERSQTAPRASLPDAIRRTTSTVSHHLNKLKAFDLVEDFRTRTGKHVSLSETGSTYLDRLDAELGRQVELDAETGGTPNSHHSAVKHAHGNAPPDAGDAPPAADRDGTAAYRTRFLGRPAHHAAVATATSGAVTAAEAPAPDDSDVEDRHTRYVSYDADRDEAVVAVRATTPLQLATSVALALSTPRFIDQVLPANRLEGLDPSARILRDGRCIGGLSAEAEDDGSVLRDNLVKWGEHLEEMTTALHHGEYDDRDDFRGEIMRSALGLSGTIAHLVDVAGADLVREIRVPTGLSEDQLDELSVTLMQMIVIESRYGHYAAYRQLFEQRQEKRQQALSPDVDAADPYGEYTGGLVIRGKRAQSLVDRVAATVDSSKEDLVEDAPEVAVTLSTTTPDRTAYAETVQRILSMKNLAPTREAVTLLRTLAGSPYAVADGICRALRSEDGRRRDLRLDEVRLALSTLGPDQLLPDAPPTVSLMVAALCAADEPLIQARLAEAADVSTQSIRNNVDVLVALDLVRDTDEGYRLALPFATDEERGEHIVPDAVDDPNSARQDLLFDATLTMLEDTSRLGDPDDPLGQAFIGFPPDFDALRRELPALNPWVRVARVLCDEPDPDAETISFGATPRQTPVTEPGGAPA